MLVPADYDSDPGRCHFGMGRSRYPASSFDAEEAAEIIAAVFEDVVVERWDRMFFPLETREEIRAY